MKKIKEEVAALKFLPKRPEMAAVVVPLVDMPPLGVVEPASVRKASREAVPVAEKRFET